MEVMKKHTGLKQLFSLLLCLCVICPALQSMAEPIPPLKPDPVRTIYIPHENFGQLSESTSDPANVYRSGTTVQSGPTSYLNNAASYWSGQPSGGAANVGSNRALYMRLPVPVLEDESFMDNENFKVTLEFNVEHKHNISGSSTTTMSLFTMKKALPEVVSSMNLSGGGVSAVKEQLFDVLERIIHGYIKGTLYQIKMDKDYLIQAGNEDTQLTWMDAKAGNWVVTPRHGKAVEINALWYNALMVMGYIQEKTGGKGKDYYKKAKKVKKAFKELFWNKDACCLYDVVNEHGPDKKMRPNQIIAVSLSFPVIDSDDAKHVVDAVHRILYTAHGLRTLSQDDPQYKGIYIGDQYARDGAYHQGTVWPWLLGKFITAYARVYKNDQDLAVKLKAFFMPFEDHLKDACIGSISEIFDGNEPLLPRGCFAQAWSVAEILRAYAEDYQPLVKHRPSR
jgi:hypothetical protein